MHELINSLMVRIDWIKNDETEYKEGYVFKATEEAANNAKARIRLAYETLGEKFVAPDVISDGEGGIDIDWEIGDKFLLVASRGNPPEQKNFIFFREGKGNDRSHGGQYYEESYFIERLNWLVS